MLSCLAAPRLAEPSCIPGACYEIYGTQDGKNYEVFFDPNTAVELVRIEG